ncbi:spore gernimation protein [Paenibacillus sp. CAA11]|uniref:spore germination lipoprotein GerD n=1 Tax=Paenibacillus sp. CAA11 TaxID=1532905 RepID=UPI000D376980|nr:spore germination lipoprotein GerD [Paenibacillus sp. CAA11]AWB46100.1 spore gernimation protein [Paenibacillus sp. CAA11]
MSRRKGYCRAICLICILIIPLTACGAEESSSSSSQGGYKETKSMILDILKSDDGKKAIMESITSGGQSGGSSGGSGSDSGSGGSGGTMGIKMIMPSQTSDQLRLAVKDTMISPEYKKEIENIMKDPKFAGDFAKAINSESKQLHMQLIKDPTYQKSVSEIMKSPEVSKMFLDLTQTPDFRKQTMTVMQETMQSPLFRMEVMELLKTVVQEQLQPKSQGGQQGASKGGQGGQGGGQGGALGGGGGGQGGGA